MQNKGQFFVLAAIIIVLSVIAVKTLIISSRSVPLGKTEFADKILENVEKEYENIVGIAAMQSNVNASLVEYLTNFTNYLRNDRDCEVLWIAIYHNSSQQDLSLSVGNFLQSKINLTLILDGATPSSATFSLDDESIGYQKFSTSSNTINITISYSLRGENRQEKIMLDVSKDFAYGFFDIKIKEEDFEARNIGTKRVLLS